MSGLPLGVMQVEVYAINLKNGWFDRDRSWHDTCALMESEILEMFEAYRSWGLEDATGRGMIVSQAPRPERIKPEGVGSELADVLIRWLDTVERYGFAAEEFDQDTTWAFTTTEDFSGHIMSGIKHVLDMWANREHADPVHFKYRLRMVLIWILSFALHYKIDLDMEYRRKIKYNEFRGYHHGGKKL